MNSVLVMHDGGNTIVSINGRIRKLDGKLPVRAIEDWISNQLKKGRKV